MPREPWNPFACGLAVRIVPCAGVVGVVLVEEEEEEEEEAWRRAEVMRGCGLK